MAIQPFTLTLLLLATVTVAVADQRLDLDVWLCYLAVDLNLVSQRMSVVRSRQQGPPRFNVSAFTDSLRQLLILLCFAQPSEDFIISNPQICAKITTADFKFSKLAARCNLSHVLFHAMNRPKHSIADLKLGKYHANEKEHNSPAVSEESAVHTARTITVSGLPIGMGHLCDDKADYNKCNGIS